MSSRVVTFVATVLPTLALPALALPAFAYTGGYSARSPHVAAGPVGPTAPQPSEKPTPPPLPPPQDGGEAPGTGGGEQLQYEHGIDRKAWYWNNQRDQELAAGPVSQRARFPSPQRPETLPVALESGQPTKLSAVRFDLVGHGIPAGSTMSRFVLVVAEGTDPGEVPTVNPEGNRVYACPATGFWPNGEAETWDTQPKADSECARGKRLSDDTQAYWTFDLSGMAAGWAKDPFTNNGVVLTGVAPGADKTDDTWQVNLKAPRADNPVTPADEYKETAHRLFAAVTYTPAAPTAPGAGGGLPDSPAAPSGGLSGGAGLGSSGLGEAPGNVPGSTAEPASAVAAKATSASTPPFSPRIPWYVWALIPVTLLGTAMVRTALADTPSVTRSGGVIETIRSRNAARWGTPETGPEGGLMARLARYLPLDRAGH